MTKFIAVVECAIEYQGKFMIIERPQGGHAEGLLSFPGGKVEVTATLLTWKGISPVIWKGWLRNRVRGVEVRRNGKRNRTCDSEP